MKFEWDPEKARQNVVRHGVQFSDAVGVLEDEAALTVRDLNSEDEERWVTLLGRALVVVYTWRDDAVRIISARRATARERWQYGASHGA